MAEKLLATVGVDLGNWEGDRPSWELVRMTIAQIIATRSTCPRNRCGAVISTREGQLLTTGYNGAVTGQPHCIDVGCHLVGGHCLRAVHAEANAIAQAAKLGIALHGTVIHCTHRPCSACTRLLIQAGIERVVYLHDYNTDLAYQLVKLMLQDSGVALRQYKG